MAVDVSREMAIVAVMLLLYTYLWFAAKFLYAYNKNRENTILGGIMLTFTFFFIGRLVLVVYDYYLTVLDYAQFETYIWWWKIGILLHGFGFGVLCLVVERQLFEGRDHYVFFLGFVVFNILMLLAPDYPSAQTFQIVAFLFTAFIPFGYIRIAMTSKGEFRKRAIYAISGFLVFVVVSFMMINPVVVFFGTVLNVSQYLVLVISSCGQIVAAALIAKGYL
ncbi:MAG TPA: hypothetical protein VKK79_21620 [Candidatus Lokiarchaeia archaeon]|nr:hypothetical protein [Candidatus Lokiarchaeia archaeon]